MTNFIGEYIISNVSICDELIEYFNNHSRKREGTVGPRSDLRKEIKDSTDLTIFPDPGVNKLIDRYILKELQVCLDQYREKYLYSKRTQAPIGIVEPFGIQHYAPGQGYHGWHTERGTSAPPECYRHLVFMTYLNDVTDDGETEFYHQNVKIKPKKGLTLIWPVDWTFTHRGIVSKTQEKYIITGWYSYLPEQEHQ